MCIFFQSKPINARGDTMIQTISEIVNCENQNHQFFQNHKIAGLLKLGNIDKQKRISPVVEFSVRLTLIINAKNLFCTIEEGGSCGMASPWQGVPRIGKERVGP
jgi:hypothetical protein